MSKTIDKHLCELADNDDHNNFHDIKVIIFRASYTNHSIEAMRILDGSKFKDKIIEEMSKTHEKINNLIESFNKDTNYKFEMMLEDRNNYCDRKKCGACGPGSMISCVNIQKYIQSVNKINFDNSALIRIIELINGELRNFINLKLT